MHNEAEGETMHNEAEGETKHNEAEGETMHNEAEGKSVYSYAPVAVALTLTEDEKKRLKNKFDIA